VVYLGNSAIHHVENHKRLYSVFHISLADLFPYLYTEIWMCLLCGKSVICLCCPSVGNSCEYKLSLMVCA